MLFEALKCLVNIREGFCSSLVCTFKKAMKNFESKVDVQKGAIRFREEIDNRYASFIQFTFSSIIAM